MKVQAVASDFPNAQALASDPLAIVACKIEETNSAMNAGHMTDDEFASRQRSLLDEMGKAQPHSLQGIHAGLWLLQDVLRQRSDPNEHDMAMLANCIRALEKFIATDKTSRE